MYTGVAMGDYPLDLITATQAGEVIHQVGNCSFTNKLPERFPACCSISVYFPFKLFNNPKEYIGKVVGLSSDRVTGKDIASIFGRVYPEKKFRHVNVS